MFLKSLKLSNFRVYSTLDFKFNKSSTVLIGDNAQGKSSFLEAIYFLSNTKSTRADRDEELITTGEESLYVAGEIDGETKLEIALQNQDGELKKRVKINGIPKRTSDYASNLAVVLFSPEDINLVTSSPGLRRYYIDQTLSQIDKVYKKNLSSYEEVVTSKNKVLKRVREGLSQTNELIFWSDQQVLLGNLITDKRKNFFDYLNSTEKKFGNFIFEYLPNLISSERLVEYATREVDSATSLIGPHRDDFIFKLDDRNLNQFGSRGEQRTAVLDLKLAEVIFVENILGSRPILLLDDIFSELDTYHRQHVIDISKLQQTVIATVEFDSYLKKQLEGAAIFSVENGQLNEITDR